MLDCASDKRKSLISNFNKARENLGVKELCLFEIVCKMGCVIVQLLQGSRSLHAYRYMISVEFH